MLSTLSRKMLMCLTGLFLGFFLLIHFLGNLQLFLPQEQAHLQFNAYSHFLSGNIIIKIVSYVLYASIILHAVDGLIITLKNRKSGGGYQTDRRGRASKWASRNMGILGTLVLIFLVIHFQNFWYIYKFGNPPLDENGNKDLLHSGGNRIQRMVVRCYLCTFNGCTLLSPDSRIIQCSQNTWPIPS